MRFYCCLIVSILGVSCAPTTKEQGKGPVLPMADRAAGKPEVKSEEKSEKKNEERAEVGELPSGRGARAVADHDGFRMPNMYALPDDSEMKSTNPKAVGGGAGTVVAKPPVEDSGKKEKE